MDYPAVATIDWPNVRAWAEASAALIAAIGTVAAFYATYRSAKAQERTLQVQADQLALQRQELAEERRARVEAENRNRRSAMLAAMDEIDRNLNSLDEGLSADAGPRSRRTYRRSAPGPICGWGLRALGSQQS